MYRSTLITCRDQRNFGGQPTPAARLLLLSIALLTTLCPVPAADAALVAIPKDSDTTVTVTQLQMLALHHRGNQGLHVEIDVRFAQENPTLRQLTVVIPVPAPATHVAMGKRGLLAPLDDFTAPLFEGGPKIKPIPAPTFKPWPTPRPQPGEMFFSTITSTGQQAVTDLKKVLTEQNVQPPEDAALDALAARNVSFVVARYLLWRDQPIPADLTLPAIVLTFPTPDLVFPTALAGDVPQVRLYAISSSKLKLDALKAAGLTTHELDPDIKPTWSDTHIPARQSHRRSSYRLIPEPVRDAIDPILRADESLEPLRGSAFSLYRIYGKDNNAATLTTDTILPR